MSVLLWGRPIGNAGGGTRAGYEEPAAVFGPGPQAIGVTCAHMAKRLAAAKLDQPRVGGRRGMGDKRRHHASGIGEAGHVDHTDSARTGADVARPEKNSRGKECGSKGE